MNHPLRNEETFFVATKLCLRCDDEIFIIAESFDGNILWQLPGGKASKDDSALGLLHTLIRETEEEIGIRSDFTEENTHIFHVEKRYERVLFQEDPIPIIFLFYLHDVDAKPDIVLSDEFSEGRWITLSEIDTLKNWRLGYDAIVRKASQTPPKNLITKS